MLNSILFPTHWHVKMTKIDPTDDRIVISAQRTDSIAICPDCQTDAHRVHGQYQRHPVDLPICGRGVKLNLAVRRFCCDNPKCRRTTFGENMETILKRYARRTHRLAAQQQQVAFELGGRAGQRLLTKQAMHTSRDTLISMIRQAAEFNNKTPRVLGVDDWAFRKGQSYGTILVDLETHQVVDLLPERNAKSLAQWLAKHPGVEIISHDRGKEYIKGATDGAPSAVQVADRWHLLKNLREAYERVFETKPDCLKAAADPTPVEQKSGCERLERVECDELAIQNSHETENQSVPSPKPQAANRPKDRSSTASPLTDKAPGVNPTVAMPKESHGLKAGLKSTTEKNDRGLLHDKQPAPDCQLPGGLSSPPPKITGTHQPPQTPSVITADTPASADRAKTALNPRKQQRFEAVKQLQQEGLSQRAIARRLEMNRRTVKKYIDAESCPMPRSRVKRAGLIDAYKSHIIKCVEQSSGTAKAIFNELQQQGFSGSYGTVARFVAAVKTSGSPQPHTQKAKRPWSPSKVAWLLVKPEAELEDDEKHSLGHIKAVDSTIEVAHTLGQRFCQMIRQADPEALLPWLADVAESGIPALTNFAKGIKADLSAVTHALKLPWSQGQTEGQVNRLKLIKRQMYGRANFDLLRKRVMGCLVPG